jgi:prepilin-type N-terminal cleavage/methylation domain-containing protein
MRGFTLLELLVVLFIITTVAFIAFPNVWSEIAKTTNLALKNLGKSREPKRDTLAVDFRNVV